MLRQETTKRRFFYGYVVTAAGFLIWSIGWGTYTPSFSVFLKCLVAEFGWSRAETSLAYSLAFLVQAGMAVVMGWLTDRLGPRLVVSVLGSTLGICYLLLSQVTGLWQFTLFYGVLGGIGVSTLTVPVMVTISRWFIKRRGFMIGIVQAGLGMGGIIFPPLVSWLILSYGWRTAYVVLGVVALVGLLTAGIFLKRDPRDMGLLPDGTSTIELQENRPSHGSLKGGGFPWGKTFRSKQFWIIAGLYSTFGFCRSTFTAHLPAHVQDLGFSLTDAANILAVVVGASVFGRVGLGRLADTIGNRPIFIMSFCVTAFSLIIALFARQLWMLYVFALLFGTAWGNQAVLRFTVTSEVFGLTSLGLLVGIFGVAESGCAALASYIAGYIFDITNAYFPIFWVALTISLVGIGLACLLKPVYRPRGHP